MASDTFDVEFFEQKLQSLKDSQDSIQQLSAWCLERKHHHKKIVATWLQVLKKVKVEHRLTLFYLANDVIQYSKRKSSEFVDSWSTTLQRATTMVRDEKVKNRVLRIFKIWEQRQIYDEEFLADLSGLISAAPKKKLDPQPSLAPEEFQAALLISTLRSCSTLEQATDARLRDLRDSNVDIESAEELCSSLKDRRRVEDAEKEIDTVVRNVENYVRALEAEIQERSQVIDLLDQADQFYETQRGEVKIVMNAYRNFGSRVKNLKKKLDELLPTFVSPIPSPDINAPSPSPDSDIELPGEETQVKNNESGVIDVTAQSLYGSYPEYEPVPVPAPEMVQGNDSTFANNFTSFMGGDVDFSSMRNLFDERSSSSRTSQHYNESLEPKPIEVINMRPSKNENSNFSITSFLKTVLPSSDDVPDPGGIPGLGLDVSDGQVEPSQHPDYRNSPTLGQLPVTPTITRINSQGTPSIGSGLNNCQMSHSTPLPVRNLSAEPHTSPYSGQNNQSNITGPFDGPANSSTVTPLPPPPLPPLFLDDENCYNKLPSKFPTWTSRSDNDSDKWKDKDYGSGKGNLNPTWSDECDNKGKNSSWMVDSDRDRWDPGSDSTWQGGRTKNKLLSETPESPPMYEKTSFADPVEYNEPQPQESLSTMGDVDHRVMPIPISVENQLPAYRLMKGADVDHRNLISLTGSPANHSNLGDLSGSFAPNNNLWSAGDQDYRQQHVQSGDIVESVDMEMSDDETDSKSKSRVLVDVRPQDRDMRVGGPPLSSHLDMDMRMTPLPAPGGQIPPVGGPHGGQLMQDVHLMHSRPPPPPPPPPPHQQFQQHPPGQSGFCQEQPPEFPHRNQSSVDFHLPGQPNFHPNRSSLPNFMPSQQEFRPDRQEPFHQPLHPFQQEPFHQSQPDFEYRDREHNVRPKQQEFLPDSSGRRYSQPVDHQRDSFHRNERNRGGGGGGGRGGFSRNRRDRYSDDHGAKHRNPSASSWKSRSQDHQQSSPTESNNQTSDNARGERDMEFDRDGGIIIPTSNKTDSLDRKSDMDSPKKRRTSHDSEHNQQQDYPLGSADCDQRVLSSAETDDRAPINQVTIIPIEANNASDDAQHNQSIPISEYEEHVESIEHSDPAVKTNATDHDSVVESIGREVNEERLDESTSGNERITGATSANGSFDDQQEHERGGGSPGKRKELPNGPQTLDIVDSSDPNVPAPQADVAPVPPMETHLMPIFEPDAPNFWPRMATPFPIWRGGPPPPPNRVVRGFRGVPPLPLRGPWLERGPLRGPATGNFSPRGSKRGIGQFWGSGGFRGRGRSSNW